MGDYDCWRMRKVVKMDEFEDAAKEPEGHVPAKNIMRVYSNLDQSQVSKSSNWLALDGTHEHGCDTV